MSRRVIGAMMRWVRTWPRSVWRTGMRPYLLRRGLNSSTRFTLLEAAAASDAIRADVSATDLLYAIVHLCTPAPGEDLAHSQRMVGVLIDGLRSGARQERS